MLAVFFIDFGVLSSFHFPSAVHQKKASNDHADEAIIIK